jgi:hypothetical protein
MTSNSAALPLWVEIWVEIRRCLESVTVGAAFSRSVHLDAGDRGARHAGRTGAVVTRSA